MRIRKTPRFYMFLLYVLSSSQFCIGQEKVFDVKDYGAVADGSSDSSQAVLSAWKDACAWSGGGGVLIPEGTYYMGPVHLRGECKGDMTFKIEGVVKASTDLSKFTTSSWIYFHHVNGLTITGRGIIDGQGASAWSSNDCKSQPQHCKTLPVSMKIESVNNGKLEGLTFLNSKFFHIFIKESQNLALQSLNITAPENSPNTDGIHITQSSGIDISDSSIATGDDCLSIGPASTNITAFNVVCGPGHGISIGSLGKESGEGDVDGVTVVDCTFIGTTSGARIKTWATSHKSKVTNVVYKNLFMDNVRKPIVIDQTYCPWGSCNKGSSSHVEVRGVEFISISGKSESKVAVELNCSKDVPCRDVEMGDIYLEYQGGESTASCSNVYGKAYGLMVPFNCDLRPQ